MQNSGKWNPAFQQQIEPLPGSLSALAATIENCSPQPAQSMPEGTELIQIARDGMVLVITLDDLPKPFTYLRWRIMLLADQGCF